MPVDHVEVVQADTRQVEAGHGRFNSRLMAVGGRAGVVLIDFSNDRRAA